MFAFDPFCTPKLQNVKIEQVMLARYYDFYLVFLLSNSNQLNNFKQE